MYSMFNNRLQKTETREKTESIFLSHGEMHSKTVYRPSSRCLPGVRVRVAPTKAACISICVSVNTSAGNRELGRGLRLTGPSRLTKWKNRLRRDAYSHHIINEYNVLIDTHHSIACMNCFIKHHGLFYDTTQRNLVSFSLRIKEA